jgi:hypothetical protein
MSNAKRRPSVDELFELLKRTSIPTVLVEGKDDIIFYRRLEEGLSDLGVDMLPAGCKGSVLELRQRITQSQIKTPIAFIVDNDTWVYFGKPEGFDDIITTTGYSIENDLYSDGDLISLLTVDEKRLFVNEVQLFSRWFALSLDRYQRQNNSFSFREHPGKVLDDQEFYHSSLVLEEGEHYPEHLYAEIQSNIGSLIRGKSLFALLTRRLSDKRRDTKFSGHQLMEFGASRKGVNFQRLHDAVRRVITAQV